MLAGLLRHRFPSRSIFRLIKAHSLTTKQQPLQSIMPPEPSANPAKRKASSDGSPGGKGKKAAATKPAAADDANHWIPAADGVGAAGGRDGSQQALVNPKRMRLLKGGPAGPGPVIYWMSRDQRIADNWALIHAAEAAAKSGSAVGVAFNLVSTDDQPNFPSYLHIVCKLWTPIIGSRVLGGRG